MMEDDKFLSNDEIYQLIADERGETKERIKKTIERFFASALKSMLYADKEVSLLYLGNIIHGKKWNKISKMKKKRNDNTRRRRGRSKYKYRMEKLGRSNYESTSTNEEVCNQSIN